MPYPGNAVATGKDVGDDLCQIEPEFIANLKQLVPSILAPENLIMKKINGQKIRIRDLAVYLQTYISIFNDEQAPRPNTVMVVCQNVLKKSQVEKSLSYKWSKISFFTQGTALAAIIVSFSGSLEFYVDSMRISIEERSSNAEKPYFGQSELEALHAEAKSKAMSQVIRTIICLR